MYATNGWNAAAEVVGPPDGIATSSTGSGSPHPLAAPADKFVLAFSWGDASPITIGTLAANKLCMRVDVYIVAAFDAGTTLKVGKTGTPEDLVAASSLDTSVVASFSFAPDKRYGSATPLILTITPGGGASTGTGLVVVYYEP